MIAEPEMVGLLARLREALTSNGVKHVFIGAMPVLVWASGRGTTDFDVVVFRGPADFERLEAALKAIGLDRKSDLPSSDHADLFRTW